MVIFAILLIVYLTFMHWINGQLMLKLISSQEKNSLLKKIIFTFGSFLFLLVMLFL